MSGSRDAWLERAVSTVLPPTAIPAVVILRGISGAGKSTLALALQASRPRSTARIISADSFFVRRGGGTYAFDPSLLGEAHGECEAEFTRAIQSGTPVIIVDNTNTSRRDYAFYEAGVNDFNAWLKTGHSTLPAYKFIVVELTCPDEASLAVLGSRNAHGVPPAGLRRQWERLRSDHDPRAVQLAPWMAPERPGAAPDAASPGAGSGGGARGWSIPPAPAESPWKAGTRLPEASSNPSSGAINPLTVRPGGAGGGEGTVTPWPRGPAAPGSPWAPPPWPGHAAASGSPWAPPPWPGHAPVAGGEGAGASGGRTVAPAPPYLHQEPPAGWEKEAPAAWGQTPASRGQVMQPQWQQQQQQPAPPPLQTRAAGPRAPSSRWGSLVSSDGAEPYPGAPHRADEAAVVQQRPPQGAARSDPAHPATPTHRDPGLPVSPALRGSPAPDAISYLSQTSLFVGLFLRRPDRAALLGRFRPRFETVQGDHVTVAHAPLLPGALTAELAALVGSRVRLAVDREYHGDGVQAVTIRWAPAAAPGPRRSGRGDGGSAPASSPLGRPVSGGRGPAVSSPRCSIRETDEGGVYVAAPSDAASAPSPYATGGGAGSEAGSEELGRALADALVADGEGEGRPGKSPPPPVDPSDAVRRALSHLDPGRGLTTNALPHVTVSVVAGVAPAAANDMLAWAARRRPSLGAPSSNDSSGGGDLGWGREDPLVLEAILGLCVRAPGSPSRTFLLSQARIREYAGSGIILAGGAEGRPRSRWGGQASGDAARE